MRPFKYEINEVNFFRFDKDMVYYKQWAGLSYAAKAVFPVIAVHLNRAGEAFPGQERISALTGLNVKTVRRAIKELMKKMACFTVKPGGRITARGRRSYLYHIHVPDGPDFPFFKSVVEGYNWAVCGSLGRALYVTLRTFAHADACDLGFEEQGPTMDFKSDYPKRVYEYCDKEPNELAEFAGISERSIPQALTQLRKAGLVEGQIGFLTVYVRPQVYFEHGPRNERNARENALD